MLQAVETLGKFFDLLSCKLKNCWDIFCPGSVEFSWVTGERNFVRLLIESHFFRRKIKTLGEKKQKQLCLQTAPSSLALCSPLRPRAGLRWGKVNVFFGYLCCPRMPCCVGAEAGGGRCLGTARVCSTVVSLLHPAPPHPIPPGPAATSSHSPGPRELLSPLLEHGFGRRCHVQQPCAPPACLACRCGAAAELRARSS